ncbi:Hypp2093 [Branchiostoma lanceolatum]|uniref:Hypp2093 protein n=1 Tax=Branchiostoma lanceolatum TaxID=7740 RepID=A0A8J9ZQ61_BRALA|nr:Hypp2093 [Branchiostoma lanceolatum]
MCSHVYCSCVRARAGYIERKFILLPDTFPECPFEEFEREMIQERRHRWLKFCVADTNEDLMKRLKKIFDFPELQAAQVEDIIVGRKRGTGIRQVADILLHGWDIRDKFRLNQAVFLTVDRGTSDDTDSSSRSVCPSPFAEPPDPAAAADGSPSQLFPQTPGQLLSEHEGLLSSFPLASSVYEDFF